jgi:hypothetical protein
MPIFAQIFVIGIIIQRKQPSWPGTVNLVQTTVLKINVDHECFTKHLEVHQAWTGLCQLHKLNIKYPI